METFTNLTKYIITLSKTSTIDPALISAWQYIFNEIKLLLTIIPKSLPSNKPNGNIILTMTSCKRLSLFMQTVNSILNTWIDISLVDKWIVIDDNSSDSDRNIMTSTYPFIDFYMKTETEKGHLYSMNKIYELLISIDPSYWIHVEDDFLFFHPTTYVSTGISGLTTLTNFNVKQIMFNRNYAETMDQINMTGHIPYSDDTFALHDHQERGTSCKYWPHFSFRPSIIDASTIIALGNFTSNNTFFEMDYALKYTAAGYKTAFFNTITNIHIGKLCNKEGQNAYSLNRIPQFNSDKISFNIKVINLKRRPDRLESITNKLKNEGLQYDIIEAIDGQDINYTSEIDKLFRENDYKSRKGFIGCALSHYYLWKQLVKSSCSYYIIIEDDAVFCNNFKYKLESIAAKLSHNELIFMGYLKTKDNKDLYYSKYNIESDTTQVTSLEKELYIGGTHCYSITKEGAQGLLDFIDMHGIKHGIDYMMVKVQKIVPVFETVPHLAFAEWPDTPDNIVDSDIQYDASSLLELEEPFQITDNIQKHEYIFLKGLDQIGHDIPTEIRTNSVNNNIKKAVECNYIAFNTLGFFKEKITSLTPSPYFSDDDGIYINKNYYFDVFKKR